MHKYLSVDFRGRLGTLQLAAIFDTQCLTVGISGYVCPSVGGSSAFTLELLVLTLAIHYDPPTKKR